MVFLSFSSLCIFSVDKWWVGFFLQLIQFGMGSLCISCHNIYGNYQGILQKVKGILPDGMRKEECMYIFRRVMVSRELYWNFMENGSG